MVIKIWNIYDSSKTYYASEDGNIFIDQNTQKPLENNNIAKNIISNLRRDSLLFSSINNGNIIISGKNYIYEVYCYFNKGENIPTYIRE